MVVDASKGSRYPGTLIANNDVYLTSARYTDCNGKQNPLGQCAAAESGIALKTGGVKSNRVNVIDNRIWGFRKTDPTNRNSKAHGPGITVCCYPVQIATFTTMSFLKMP